MAKKKRNPIPIDPPTEAIVPTPDPVSPPVTSSPSEADNTTESTRGLPEVLKPYMWKPGMSSPNPGGRPKTKPLTDIKALIEEIDPKSKQTLKAQLIEVLVKRAKAAFGSFGTRYLQIGDPIDIYSSDLANKRNSTAITISAIEPTTQIVRVSAAQTLTAGDIVVRQ